jgi:acyl-CoA dehydrogenase
MTALYSSHALDMERRVERFVRDVVAAYEKDLRRDHHDGPADELIAEIREKARAAGVLTSHVLTDSGHLTQRETALVLRMSGLSPLGPPACNTAALRGDLPRNASGKILKRELQMQMLG